MLGGRDSEHVPHYFIGDMIFNLLSSDNIHARALLSIAITEMYGLKQLIDEPTRITPSSSTLIYLIFTSHHHHLSVLGYLMLAYAITA